MIDIKYDNVAGADRIVRSCDIRCQRSFAASAKELSTMALKSTH